MEAGIASPQTFKSGRAIALSIQVTAESGDGDQGVTEREGIFF